LDELNQALADAEALKFSKALVQPRARGVRARSQTSQAT
jgi:hypothetical protein